MMKQDFNELISSALKARRMSTVVHKSPLALWFFKGKMMQRIPG